MYDSASNAFQVEMLAAALRADYGDAKAFLEALATRFEGALPTYTKVTRHFGLGERPVKEIIISLGDYQYRMSRERHGPLVSQRGHLVRGIVLSSDTIPVEQWIQEIAESLAHLAARSSLAHAALSRFLLQ